MIAAALPFVAMLVASVPWIVLATRHVGHRLGIVLPTASVVLLSMLVLVVTRVTGLEIQTTLFVVLAVVLAGGIVLLVRSGVRPTLPGRAAVLTWLPASLGAVIWFTMVGIAPLVPGASQLSWVLNGDGSNNIHEARGYLFLNGITLSSDYPVPAVRALLLLAIAGDRNVGASTADLLRHDLGGLVTLWTIGLAVTSVLLGVVASSLVPRTRLLVIAIVAATGSLFTLTWFVSGIPIEFGYLNTAISIPLVMCCWIVYLEHRRSATVVLVTLAVLGTLLVATWTALAIVPAAIALVIVSRRWREIRVLRGTSGLVIAGSLVLLIAFVALVTGPLIARNLSVLGTPGHGFPVTVWLLVGLLAVCIGGAAALSPRLDPPIVRGTIALGGASIVGVGILFIASREQPDPFSGYYSSKFSWIMCVLLIAIAFSIAAAALTLLPRASITAPLAAVALGVLTIAALTAGPQPYRALPSIVQPIDRVLGGTVWADGEASAEVIFDNLSDPGTTLLWNSGNPDEAFINFWVLEYRGGGAGAGPDRDLVLKDFEFTGYRELRDKGHYTVPDLTTLCDIAGRLPQPLTIVTLDDGLAADFAAECTGVEATFARE